MLRCAEDRPVFTAAQGIAPLPEWYSPPSDQLLDDSRLIDHHATAPSSSSSRAALPILARTAAALSQHEGMYWDRRKGRWIGLAFRFRFPSSLADHIQRDPRSSQRYARPTASFQHRPSERCHMMLDQSTPPVDQFVRKHRRRKQQQSSLAARNFAPYASQATAIQKEPSHNRQTRPLGSSPQSPLAVKACTPLDSPNIVPSDLDDAESRFEEDPFSASITFPHLDHAIAVHQFGAISASEARPIAWLDDLDVEQFLSSALDFQHGEDLQKGEVNSVGMLLGLRGPVGGVPPSSPPPPLFPEIRITPPRGIQWQDDGPANMAKALEVWAIAKEHPGYRRQ